MANDNDVFDRHRGLLFSVAYRILGSAVGAAPPRNLRRAVAAGADPDRKRRGPRRRGRRIGVDGDARRAGEPQPPLERAVFVLKEVFDFSYAEIAAAVERSEATVRQTARRARNHVQARRPRFAEDRTKTRQATERFFAAATGDDINALME